MERRQDKYKDETTEAPKLSRVKKNQSLYNEINNKIGYEEITTFNSGTEIDLSTLNAEKPRREEYQKIKEYKSIIDADDEKEVKHIYRTENKPKTFDINEALDEAKRNRKEDDELEKKRKLSGDESVLSSLNRKYLHSKDFDEQDSDELKDLINTITSKTLVDDVKDEEEKELLSDLLATTIDIKLEQELSNEEINKLYGENTLNKVELTDEFDETLDTDTIDTEQLENSFFTHSVELKKDDLVDDDKKEEKEDDEDEEDDDSGIGKIIIIVVIALSILLLITFFLLKCFGF